MISSLWHGWSHDCGLVDQMTADISHDWNDQVNGDVDHVTEHVTDRWKPLQLISAPFSQDNLFRLLDPTTTHQDMWPLPSGLWSLLSGSWSPLSGLSWLPGPKERNAQHPCTVHISLRWPPNRNANSLYFINNVTCWTFTEDTDRLQPSDAGLQCDIQNTELGDITRLLTFLETHWIIHEWTDFPASWNVTFQQNSSVWHWHCDWLPLKKLLVFLSNISTDSLGHVTWPQQCYSADQDRVSW